MVFNVFVVNWTAWMSSMPGTMPRRHRLFQFAGVLPIATFTG